MNIAKKARDSRGTDEFYIVICRADRREDGAKGRYEVCRSSEPVFFELVAAEAYAAQINPSREPIVCKTVCAPFGASS